MSTSRTHPVVLTLQRIVADRGISKSELARRLGWGRMQLHRRLAGEAPLTVEELEEIAAVLAVPLSVLLPADDQPAQVTA